MAYNRELSQFASLVDIQDTSKGIGFSTDLTVAGIVTATRFYGSGRFLTDIAAQASSPGGNNKQIQFNNNSTTDGAFDFYYDVSTTSVGIGTINPMSKLHVNDVSSTKIYSNQTYRTDANIPTGIGIGVNYFPSYTTPGTQTSYGIANQSYIQANVIAGSTNNGYIRSGVDVAFRGRTSTDNGTLAEITGRRIAFGHWNDAPTFINPITTNAFGLIVNGYAYTGNITNITGIYISPIGNVINQSSVKNAYGIYSDIKTVDGINSAYNLYISGSAQNYISGNIGIGITIPVSNLDVNGFIISRNGSLIFSSLNNSNNWVSPSLPSATNVDHIWYDDANIYGLTGTYHFVTDSTYQSNGNSALRAGGFYNMNDTGTALQRLQITGGAYVSGSIGIGTTTPTSKLHVIGDSNISSNSYIGNNSYITGSIGIGTTTLTSKLNVIGNSYISGNLGIGTTNPSSKLYINGDAYVTGVVTSKNVNIENSLTIKNQSIEYLVSTYSALYSIVFGL